MRFVLIGILFIFFGCSDKKPITPNISHPKTSKEGEKILDMGEIMVLRNKEIIRGGCWDYIDTLYSRAGFTRDKRDYIFKGKKSLSTMAPFHLIMPGDWLYFFNHSYGKVEHSGIFVRWTNKNKKEALLLSYQGESRKKPGRYTIYDITNTYTIIRPQK